MEEYGYDVSVPIAHSRLKIQLSPLEDQSFKLRIDAIDVSRKIKSTELLSDAILSFQSFICVVKELRRPIIDF